MDLKERFVDLWQRLEARGDPEKVFDRLIKRYQQRHRHYHNVAHLEFGLGQLDLIASEAAHPDWVEFAFFFHDSVYRIRASDNEEQSCALAIEVLRKARVHAGVRVYVVGCIMATKHDVEARSADQQVISDIDLAILGQPRTVFTEYERQVREEYKRVPKKVFWEVRKEILTGFLRRSHIYSTRLFQELYEKQARENLTWTINNH